MPGTKLACPHCDHDGSKETTKSPLESYGFNYLADDVVCRDVRGYDDSGRLQLSSDFQCEGSRGVNPRIECRSCWQTFPVPEGLLWMVAAEQPAGTPEEKDEAGPGGEAGGEAAGSAADKITRGLTVLLRQVLDELEGPRAAQIAAIEARFSGDVAGLREQTASLTAIEQLLAPKVTATEAAQRALEEGSLALAEAQGKLQQQLDEQAERFEKALEALQNSLNDRAGSLDGLVQALQGRLATQADAIRGLHATVEDQAKHRADLLSAARRLQEIAGVIEPSKPLPEEL